MLLLQDFQPRVPETGPDDPRHALQENGGPADFWYLDEGDILCHPARVLSHLALSDTAEAKIGVKEIDKRQVHPLRFRSRHHSPCSHSGHHRHGSTRQHHTGGRGVTTTLHRRPTLGNSGCNSSHARARSAVPGPPTQNLPSFAKVWV